jgi:hypothetical protein
LILKDQVTRFRQATGGAAAGPVALIAHSQGGLDARFALKTLALEGVSELLSLGVPHLGTPAADWVVRQRESRSLWYLLLRILGDYDLEALRFAGELTSGFLAKHAPLFEGIAGVRYASARGVCRTDCGKLLRLGGWLMGVPPEGDGLIPGATQRYGQDLGEYNLDHLQQVGVDSTKKAERLRLFEKLRPALARTDAAQ